jgi:putative ABC transport system ATP-binding protein
LELLVANDLVKTYKTGDHVIRAVQQVSLTLSKGEITALIGPSGSGKSTLLHLLGGLDRPDKGTVHLEGRAYGSLSSEELTLLRRRRIGFVFQAHNLLAQLNVEENIALPLLLDGKRPEPRFLNEVITAVGLSERRMHRPGQLSGGQQQRVAIARALITRPALLLADEPTGQLDSKTGQEIMDLLRRLCTKQGVAALIVTHDPKVLAYADRVLRMQDGRVEAVGGKELGVS